MEVKNLSRERELREIKELLKDIKKELGVINQFLMNQDMRR